MEDILCPEFFPMGSWETCVDFYLLHFGRIWNSRFRSGRGKKRILVRQTSDVLVWETYHVGQFDDHRGHRRHAENWASIISIFLLRF